MKILAYYILTFLISLFIGDGIFLLLYFGLNENLILSVSAGAGAFLLIFIIAIVLNILIIKKERKERKMKKD